MKILVLLLSSVLLFAGCATPPNRAYWGADPKTLTQSPLGNIPRPVGLYEKLTVIEFDEQGDLWDHNQLRLASARLKKAKKRPLLVTYAHGWMNSARPDNSDLRTFSELLKNIDKKLGGNFEVQGVFIGWRGKSSEMWLGIPGLAQVSHFGSFWSRKAATNRVASIPLSQTLYSLVGDARRKGKQLTGNPGIGILIGHSFGGRTLERTLGPVFVAQASTTDSQNVFPADLVILINPATEALYARQLRSALRKWDKDYPLVVSVTSETDSATGWIWKRALELTAIRPGILLEKKIDKENVRKSSFTDYRVYGLGRGANKDETKGYEGQFGYVSTTSGHRPELVTHIVRPTSESTTTNDAFERNLQSATAESIWVNVNGETKAYALLDSREHYYEYKDRHQDNGYKHYRHYFHNEGASAYWIIRVPNEILPDHSGLADKGGIFSSEMRDLLAGIVRVAKVGQRNAPPTLAVATPADGVPLSQ